MFHIIEWCLLYHNTCVVHLVSAYSLERKVVFSRESEFPSISAETLAAMKKPPDPFLHLSQPPTQSTAQPYLFLSANQPHFMNPEISALIENHFRADSLELVLDFVNTRPIPAYSSSINLRSTHGPVFCFSLCRPSSPMGADSVSSSAPRNRPLFCLKSPLDLLPLFLKLFRLAPWTAYFSTTSV